MPIKSNCPQCGREFSYSPSAKLTYCSQKCYWEAHRKKVKCENCGKVFPSFKYISRRFCSISCKSVAQHRLNRGGVGPTETRICLQCKKPFEFKRQFSKTTPGKYCSYKCSGLSSRLPNTSNARGPNWRTQIKTVRKRDNDTCQICGKHTGGKSMKGRFAVHHIKAYRFFNGDFESANRLSNLILLCRVCHARVEFGKLPCPLPLPFS